jgi:hypothetical protein
MDGSMLANGGTIGNQYSGPGSGGGICIKCNTFQGSGLLSAVGGDIQRTDDKMPGAGGGGRIAILYDTTAQAGVSPKPTVRLNAAGGSENQWQMTVPRVRATRGYPGSLYLSDNQFFDLTKIQGGEIMVPGVTAWAINSLSLSNSLIGFPAGFSLTVTQDLTIADGGGLDMSNAVVNIGRDLIMNSDGRGGAFFRGGPSQQIGVGRNISLSMGWLDLSSVESPSATLPVGGSITLTNKAMAYFSSGETNNSTSYGLLVNVTGNINITTNCWVYPYSHPTNGGSVYFQAANMTVSGSAGIDASLGGFAGRTNDSTGYGYGPGGSQCSTGKDPGGAGYGGMGHAGGTGLPGGPTYGSSNHPVDPGSGAGSAKIYHHASDDGTAGGGLIHVQATDSVVVDGSFLANGGDKPNSYAACGSGGGIYIHCKQFSGAGLLKANGGSMARNAWDYGGSGGGGRIAVAYTVSSSWSGAMQANGGIGGYTGNDGTNGTVVFMLVAPANPGTLLLIE